MPHDKNNAKLIVGDVVMVPARVTAIQEGEEYCNLSLVTVEPMHPSTNKTTLNLNTKQVIRHMGGEKYDAIKAKIAAPPSADRELTILTSDDVGTLELIDRS